MFSPEYTRHVVLTSLQTRIFFDMEIGRSFDVHAWLHAPAKSCPSIYHALNFAMREHQRWESDQWRDREREMGVYIEQTLR